MAVKQGKAKLLTVFAVALLLCAGFVVLVQFTGTVQAITHYLTEDFESYNSIGWTNTTVEGELAVNSTAMLEGSNGLLSYLNGANPSKAFLSKSVAMGTYANFSFLYKCVQINVFNTQDCKLIEFTNSTTHEIARFGIYNNGSDYWRVLANGTAVYATSPPTAGNVYLITGQVSLAAGTGFVSLSVNGTLKCNVTGLTNSGFNNIEVVNFGLYAAQLGPDNEAYFDTLDINDINSTGATSPLYNHDMLLQANGSALKMPNGTVVVLKGINKAEMCDDPDGTWNGSTMWTDANVEVELAAMQALGINCIRVHMSVYDWQLNASEEHSAIGQPEAMQRLCNLSAAHGIWIIGDGYRTGDYYVNSTDQEAFPYPPYTTNSYLADASEFEEWWSNITVVMKEYGNFIAEPWNEGYISNSTEFFEVYQTIINQSRTNGFIQPIIVQYGVSGWINLNFPSIDPPTGNWKLNWYYYCNLTDTQDNWVISDHKYRNHIHHTLPTYENAYLYADILSAYDYMGYFNFTDTRPLFIGEIGANVWETGASWEKEEEAFNNSMSILTTYNISYCGFWWRSIGQYALINSAFAPNKGGAVFFAYTGTGYNITLDTTSDGSISPISGLHARVSNYNQSFIATASSGCSFVNWTITFANTTVVALTDATSYLVIDQNLTAKAFFASTSTVEYFMDTPWGNIDKIGETPKDIIGKINEVP